LSISQLDVTREGKLSPQAWLLHISRENKLWCGDNVENKGNSFFEGAWSGAFEDFDFSACADVFGSGAAKKSDGWLLVPPSHTLEAIYVLRTNEGEWVASNSIAFIKQYTGFEFLESESKLLRSFIGIVRGIDRSPARIKSSRGEFYVLHHHNALLGKDGLSARPKPLSPNFSDFKTYRDYLEGTVKAVAANGSAKERRATFELLATVSSGYDSPACAVLASAAGCKKAITFFNGRGGDSDDGTEIAEKLGMQVTSFQRPNVVGKIKECAADLFATGMQAEDLVYEPLHGRLSQRLFVTGFHGDKVWEKLGKRSSVLQRGDVSGSSLGEFRLSQAFIHMPVPFIGALRHADIKEIANSPEMQRFSVGGSVGGWYDRPVPRRIAEEAGIRRDAFGQSKKMISILAFSNQRLLANQVREEIEGQLNERRLREWLRYRIYSTWFSAQMFLYRFFYRSAELVTRLVTTSRTFLPQVCLRFLWGRPSWTFFEHSHPFNGLAFKWALSVVSKRYDLWSSDLKRS